MMRSNWLRILPLLVVVTGYLPTDVYAAEQAPDAVRAKADDEAAVRAAITAYRQALEQRNVETVKGYWTPDADYVDQQGRAYKIHAGLSEAKRLAQEGMHLAHFAPKTETLGVRFVTRDVAIEDGEFERVGSAAGPAAQGRYTAVWVKRDGKWLIDGLRESPVHVEDSSDALDDLAWLIGHWEAEGAHGKAQVICEWGKGQSYIVAHMKLDAPGEGLVTATQLIGWDPNQQRIRSFLFDSRGCFTEGIWTDEGDAWVVKAIETHPNGKRVSSTRLYSRIDENTAIWESIDDDPAGAATADVRFRLTRKKSEK